MERLESPKSCRQLLRIQMILPLLLRLVIQSRVVHFCFPNNSMGSGGLHKKVLKKSMVYEITLAAMDR